MTTFHFFFHNWHLYLLISWSNCFLFKNFSISKLKYWIAFHNNSLEISSRDERFSIFLTFKENRFKHAMVYISATTKLLSAIELLTLSFKNKCHLKIKRSSTSFPDTNYFFPRAVFPNYPFLSSSPSCFCSSTSQSSYYAGKIRTSHLDDLLRTTQNLTIVPERSNISDRKVGCLSR